MILNTIKIKNFRQYQQEEIEIAGSKDEKNFTIIQGMNGAGKSNFLNAMTWCLYGEEHHKVAKYEGLPLLNTVTHNDLEVGEICEVKVEMKMCDNENLMFFSRKIEFKKLKNGDVKVLRYPESGDDGSIFEICKLNGDDWETSCDPNFTLNKLIPKDLIEYFFFDGEQLNYYFKEKSGAKIHDAVFQISQLNLLENVITHLTNRRSEFRGKLKDSNPKAEKIAEKLELMEKSLSSYKEDYKRVESDLYEASSKEDEYNRKLISKSDGKEKELRNSKIELERDVKESVDEIAELESDLENAIIKNSPLIFTYECLKKMKKLIKKSGQQGKLPPKVKKEFIERLIEENKCICGTDLSKNEECRTHLNELMDTCEDISNISEELVGESVSLTALINNLESFVSQKNKLTNDIRKQNEIKDRKTEQLNEVEIKLEKYDLEDIDNISKKLKEYKELRYSLTEKKVSYKHNIKDTDKLIKKFNKELKEEMAKENIHKTLKSILSFCNESLDASKFLMEGIMEEIRLEVEKKTKDQFFNLIWKKEAFKDVKIDKNYNVSVIHESGLNALGNLSAGEIQVLALSFMAALNTVSGFNVPIIIDTPLGKLSKEPKRNIAENLPNYLKGKQVIMLVTEEEYTYEVKNALSSRVGKEYKIKFLESEKGGISKVVSYENN